MTTTNLYSLLAQFLSPTLSQETRAELLQTIHAGGVDWGGLLHQANLQLVTPLWHYNLHRNCLLEKLPQDLAEYLGALHAANRDRNKSFVDALTEVLGLCREEGLCPVLLKGAAMLVDDLYGDAGARMQSDLDILLPPDAASVLSARLQQHGYQYFEPEPIIIDNTAPSVHHHHLKMLSKPGTPVVIEIHYRIARGRGGGVFSDAPTVPTDVAGLECRMFAPEWRDLHNILHAMISDRGTINSLVPLKAAAESAWLRQRYPDADYKGLSEVADAFGCGRDYRLYRAVSQRLGLWPDDDDSSASVSTFRVNRCLEHGGSLTLERKPRALSLYLSLYKNLHFPRWAWDYICYMDSSRSTWDRLKKMGSYLLRPASWKKV